MEGRLGRFLDKIAGVPKTADRINEAFISLEEKRERGGVSTFQIYDEILKRHPLALLYPGEGLGKAIDEEIKRLQSERLIEVSGYTRRNGVVEINFRRINPPEQPATSK